MNVLAAEALAPSMLVAAALSVAAPLAGALALSAGYRPGSLRRFATALVGLALAASLAIAGSWAAGAGTPVAVGGRLAGGALVCLDGLTAVLLPYVALVELSILLAAPRRALEPEAVARKLFGTAATCALFLTSHPLALVVLWIFTALATWISVRSTPGGAEAARVFAIAMTAAVACMAVGTMLLVVDPPWDAAAGWAGTAGGWLVALAVLIRKGIFPFHSWYPALFSGGTMATALAATMPQVASYTAVRLLIGHVDHPEGVATELVVLSQLALVTTTYGAALSIVQRDLRGLIGTLAMSQSAMVLAGLAGTLPMELDGAFCVWIASGLALTGLGLVSWALESRAGPIRLDSPQGRFWDAPALAAFFLLFGLAGIGLPGTLSFVADDLIVSGILDEQLHAGILVVLATMFSGIAVMRGWFGVFGGPVEPDGSRHAILPRERVAFTALLATLFILGLWPGPLVRIVDQAAERLLGVAAPAGAGAAAVVPHHGAGLQESAPGS
jgi:NADH-quinone oxidoreductase subunit M